MWEFLKSCSSIGRFITALLIGLLGSLFLGCLLVLEAFLRWELPKKDPKFCVYRMIRWWRNKLDDWSMP